MTWTDNVTLEVSFGFGSGPLAASPTWTNVTTDVRALTISRGRSSTRRPFDVGTGTLVMDNTGGEYDPANTGATHYPNVKLGVPVRIRATHNVTTYDLFRGYVSRWPLAYEQPNEARAELEITEMWAVARRAQYATDSSIGAFPASSDRPSAKIDDILDDVGWPAGLRSLESSDTDITASVAYEGPADALIDDLVDAEQGTFFIAGDGTATFYSRTHYAGVAASATFSDDGADIPYSDLVLSYSDDQTINEAIITAADGSIGTATDATSITSYGYWRLRFNPAGVYATVPDAPWRSIETYGSATIASEPYATNIAEWLVLKYKDINVSIAGLTIWPERSPSTMWPVALGLELGDVVNVEFTGPSATTLDQNVRLERIEHEITPGMWRVTYGCWPLATVETDANYWILGTSNDLGTDTKLA